jgi:xanthine dehydrogenase YagS FAD-binding subunit
VNLLPIAELRGIRLEHGALRLGPLATLARIESESPLRNSPLRAIAEAAGSAANPQIRNVATVGGNLCQRPRCWYFRSADFVCLKKGGTVCYAAGGENRYHAILGGGPSYIVHPSTMATALSAFDTTLRLVSHGGHGRELPLDRFFVRPSEDETRENRLEPGELIAEITVAAPAAGTVSAYEVVKERQVFDWPLAEAAVSLALRGGVVEKARVVLGGVATIPWRSEAAEAALVGKRVDAASAAAAGKAAVAGAKPLRENGYKVAIAASVVERAVLRAAGAA